MARPGNDVVIPRGGNPSVRLMPVPPSEFRFGMLGSPVATVPGFNESMGNDEFALGEDVGQEAPPK